jgi:alanyl aminopeptidase
LEQARAVLWLNADSLSVTQVTTERPEARTTLLTGQEQFVGIAFEPALTAGRHRVTLTFEAEQSQDSTRGVFALQDGGAWYAMTQFEAVSARRAFPCFDEPGFKTPWQLTLQVPQDLIAVSNTQIESETPGTDGLKTVRFAETRPLPSYLVAFAVGPWEFVDLGRVGANPTSTRIIVPRGRRADAEFAAARLSRTVPATGAVGSAFRTRSTSSTISRSRSRSVSPWRMPVLSPMAPRFFSRNLTQQHRGSGAALPTWARTK